VEEEFLSRKKVQERNCRMEETATTMQDTKNKHIDKHEQDHECGEHDELFRRTNAESNELLLY